MAMLAEPRRRKRYNLCPRGKALYEDENRFGTKMLEKMGWTKGNGLGANQDGEKDFVRIRFKNDAEGLGFEARDDQWTTHEEGFNGLLKSLNGDENEANGKESEPEEEVRPMGFGFKAEEPEEPTKKTLKEKISGVSLEERSKQSRARVHYKKFTRGKDLSQYSEKDLANIFGKKATDDIDVPVPVEVEEPKEEKLVDPNFAGVQTVSTGLSVSDYFKQKMEAMKNKLKKGAESTPTGAEVQVNSHDEKLQETITENVQEPSKKKKKKKDKENTAEPPIAEEEVDQSPPKQKKNKKSKRSSQDETEQSMVMCVEEQLVASDESNPAKRKKKKKDKQDEASEDLVETKEQFEEPAPKKKKKSKKTELVDTEIILIDDELPNDDNASKKKSKSKKSEVTNETQEESTIAIVEETSTKKKKSKKEKKEKKDVDTMENESKETTPTVPKATEKTSKKKKSNTDAEPVPEDSKLAVAVEKEVKNSKRTGRKHTDDTNSKWST
ncbi:PIN2/TERF1-interacting telomerase inhibitor 1 isoform X2 [Drosophila elegans]|uniref:PIN2/TERF1-interacting telomerase inhibitor 1 isoform X2 n=1 Tax=Drosophila elegans TaxID=30023 RepID=UPI0007E754B2|nr:PIN2/TERF1-interacting telomerase inhibitor 1 isoform X2 [Drosophila elegans]